MTQPQLEAEYPCAECGKLRTKAEGGTTFTVCDECWDTREESKKNPTTNDWLILISTEKVAQQTIYELRQQLSDEAAARTEITRKYHDECAKLAQELKDERASVRRQKEMVEVWRIRAEAYKQNAEGTGKELTTTAARLAEAMKRLESCVVSVNRQYPHRRDSNEDSKFLLFLSGKLNEVFSPAEPTAIDEALRNKWIDEVEAIRAATKQAT